MKLSDLSPNPQNPRKITDDKLKMLKASLDNFGDLSGIVFNRTSQTLSGGHQRLKCLPPDSEIVITSQYAEKNKQGTVAVGFVFIDGERYSYREVEWDELTEKAANLAANTHGGEWDNKQRIEWLLELEANNYPIEITGIDKEEQEDLMAPFRTMPEGLTDADAVPTSRDTDIKLGDLFQLGDHRLLCGDSTSVEAVTRLMNGEKADMVFTDPPYGIGYEYNEHNDDSPEENFRLVADAFKHHECGKVWTPGKMNLERDLSRFGKAKIAIWYKKFAGAGSGLGGASTFEPILIVDPKERKLPNDVIVLGTDREELNGVSLRVLHSCPKPVDLYSQLINAFSAPSDKIAEPFCGSGSTLIACEKTNRKCYGMEIDPQYVQVILDRWEAFTGKKATKL